MEVSKGKFLPQNISVSDMEYYRVVLYALTYGCLSEFYLGMNGGDGLEHCGMFVFAIYIYLQDL